MQNWGKAKSYFHVIKISSKELLKKYKIPQKLQNWAFSITNGSYEYSE